MKASQLINSENIIVAHIATKLSNEGKEDWNFNSAGNYFLSPDSTEMYDVKTLTFHCWDDVKNNYKKHSEKEIQNAYQRMEIFVDQAYDMIKKAQDIADEYGLEFSFKPSYGMGGTYYGKGSEGYYDNDPLREEGEWVSSSQSC